MIAKSSTARCEAYAHFMRSLMDKSIVKDVIVTSDGKEFDNRDAAEQHVFHHIINNYVGPDQLEMADRHIRIEGRVIPKREVFDTLYDKDSDTQLQLVISGHSMTYSLIDRDAFDDSMLQHQLITDITYEVLTARSIRLARRFSVDENLDATVKMMAEAMLDALENSRQIEAEIKKKKEEHTLTPSS